MLPTKLIFYPMKKSFLKEVPTRVNVKFLFVKFVIIYWELKRRKASKNGLFFASTMSQ